VVYADVELDSVLGGIEVIGQVRATWVGECRRCLGPVGGELVADVRELYRPLGPTEDDEETYPIDGDHLDLAPLVRDAVLLDLPLAPLCRADCAGLCPICGADRNSEACGCPVELGDPRWGALDTLRLPAGEG
jgi:uncharacterized protein